MFKTALALGRRAITFLALAGCASVIGACKHNQNEQSSTPPDGATRAPAARSLTQSSAPPAPSQYLGPTGGVQGVVFVKGDAPPDQPDLIAKVPTKCAAAKQTFGKLFREGMLRTLADALVTVTHYSGNVPARSTVVPVEARDCAWKSRTVALQVGQNLEIISKDGEPYMPNLLGASQRAMRVAIPGGSGVPIFVQEPGHYLLTDMLHAFNSADVFVLRYSTFAVTGLDGKYAISNIPVGTARVSALLPQTKKTSEREVKIEAGKLTNVDFEIAFDRAEYERELAPSAADAGSSRKPRALPGSNSARPRIPEIR